MGVTTDIAVYDHLRSTDTDDAVYRVVGLQNDRVTLLRVADGDGRRAQTGEATTISTFGPAANPDENRALGTALTTAVGNVYWSFRTVLTSLATNPLPSLLALALFLAGWFGEGVLPVPDWAFGVLTMAGITGLASVGSGRL